jgi:hypothetical protein
MYKVYCINKYPGKCSINVLLIGKSCPMLYNLCMFMIIKLKDLMLQTPSSNICIDQYQNIRYLGTKEKQITSPCQKTESVCIK